MEFPTEVEFEEYETQHGSVLKWREVPTEVNYHIETVEQINTKLGRSTNVSLVDKDGKTLKAFTTSCLTNDLKDFSWKEKLFIRPLAKWQSFKNPGQSYYHHEIVLQH